MTVMTTPPAKQRYLTDTTPERVARARADRDEGLRKLATAVTVACGRGATWEQIREAVEKAVREAVTVEGQGAILAATARARVNDGDDSF